MFQFFPPQIHTSDIEKKEALLLNKKRRRLILHNKAPMWNDASQVKSDLKKKKTFHILFLPFWWTFSNFFD